MTANRNRKRTNKSNKRGRKLKKNRVVYIIESLVLILAAIFLAAFGSAPFIDPISLICTAAASALFACVLFLTNSRVIVIAGLTSFAAACITGKGPVGAAASLTYIVVGAFIYFGVKIKKPRNAEKTGKTEKTEKTEKKSEQNYVKRTQITVAAAGFLAVFYAAMLAVSVVISTGGFSIAAAESVIDGYLTDAIEVYIGYSQSLTQYTASIDAEQAANFIESYKREIFINMKAILPACYIIYNLFAAYITTALFKPMYNIFIPLANPARKRIRNKYWRINMSVISAVIMIASIFLAVAFTSGGNLLPAIVVTNLIYILVPGFCIMGIYFASDKMFGGSAGIFPVILLIGAAVISFIYPLVMVAAMALFMVMGLYAALIGDIRKFYEKTKKLMFGDDDDDDDYID